MRTDTETLVKLEVLMLTPAEREHLLFLVRVSDREGFYYGPAAQYADRLQRIHKKLRALRAAAGLNPEEYNQ